MGKTLWAETGKLWLFSFFRIPMIFWLRPRVLALSATSAEIKIPLTRRSKNHLHSMYFGALCVGADLAGGIQLMRILGKDIAKVSFAFKDVKGEFLKRPEADVHFVCKEGENVTQLIEKARISKERESTQVQITARVPKLNNEVVAEFTLTLSLKFKL